MRTTLNIDGDVLIAAKELARREHKTAGELVSDLMREALRARAGSAGETRTQRDLSCRGLIEANNSVSTAIPTSNVFRGFMPRPH